MHLILINSQKIKYHYLLLVFLWILAIILVNPLREFPLNDDWVYAWSVMQLMEHGSFMIHPWVAVTLVSHILWGGLFGSVFGFSFSVLRISTLIMGLAGTLVSYKVFEELLKDRRKALLYSLFIAFNPVFFNLSFTYMTDLTFYTMVVLSSWFYFRSFREEDRYSIYFATVFAVLAVLTRQIGLFVPLSAFFTLLLVRRKILNKKVLVFFLSTLFVAVVMFGYIFWLERTAGKPESFRDVGQFVESGNFILVILQRMVDHTGRWLAETGLWFLPLIFFFTWRTWNHFKKFILSAGILTALLSIPIVLQTSHFPGGNIFYVIGLGPLTLADAYLFGMREWGTLQETLTHILRTMALAGGVMLAWLILAGTFDVFTRLREQKDDLTIAKLFSLFLILTYQAVFLGSFTYFDRYGIILFVPVLILISPSGIMRKGAMRWERSVYAVFAALLILFSIAATRDYLAWNEARWDAALELEESGIPPGMIDGGHEYNGWHGTSFDKYGRWDPAAFDYLLTFRPLEGCEVIGTQPWTRLIPYGKEEIFVLRKAGQGHHFPSK
jgi:4-amino-4-deoxy-L-arabinose transferase-like glycosyltransferase